MFVTETDWENVIDAEDDVNSACSNFTKTFLNITKTCIPTREVVNCFPIHLAIYCFEIIKMFVNIIVKPLLRLFR
jgi:hypothetical protein